MQQTPGSEHCDLSNDDITQTDNNSEASVCINLSPYEGLVPKGKLQVLLVSNQPVLVARLEGAIQKSDDIAICNRSVSINDAFNYLASHRPEIILLNLAINPEDGLHLTKHVSTNFPGVGIIILSEQEKAHHVVDALSAGAHAFCTTDIESERLLTAIRCVHHGDYWLDCQSAKKILSLYGAKQLPAQGAGHHDGKILSAREVEVLTLIMQGLTNQEIASRLTISLATAKAHVRNILSKLAVADRTQAAVEALKRGIV